MTKANPLGLIARFFAVVFCLSLAQEALAAEPIIPGGNARTEVRTVVQMFVSAWNRGNTDALTNLFTPEGTFTTPRGTKAKGRPAIRTLLTQEQRELYRGTTLIAQVDAIAFPNPGTAIARGAYTLHGVNAASAAEVAAQGIFSFQLTRRGGSAWRIESARIFRY